MEMSLCIRLEVDVPQVRRESRRRLIRLISHDFAETCSTFISALW